MTEAKPCLPYKCRWSGLTMIHAPACPNAAPKASEAPVECLDGCRWNIDPQGRNFFFHAPACPNSSDACEDPLCDLKKDHATPHRLRKPAPAPEPDPLVGIDAQKWAQEFMRIWSGRWSEVDEGLMIGWFANAIMRGFDEGQRRLRKQHGCELPPVEQGPTTAPTPEAMTIAKAILKEVGNEYPPSHRPAHGLRIFGHGVESARAHKEGVSR